MTFTLIKRGAVVAALALLALSAIAAAHALNGESHGAVAQQLTVEIPETWKDGGITVNGEGSVEIEADIANLSMGVDVIDESVSAARDAAAAKLTAMIQAVKMHGIHDDDITTQGINIRPETVWVEEQIDLGGGEFVSAGRSRIIGYRVTNRIDVVVRDLDTVSDVIDDATDAGGDAARIDSIYFTASDTSEAAVKARQLAAANARTTATLYANAMAVTLGPVVSITETGASFPIATDDFVVESEALFARSAQTPVASGSITVTARIRATFSILGVMPLIQTE